MDKEAGCRFSVDIDFRAETTRAGKASSVSPLSLQLLSVPGRMQSMRCKIEKKVSDSSLLTYLVIIECGRRKSVLVLLAWIFGEVAGAEVVETRVTICGTKGAAVTAT